MFNRKSSINIIKKHNFLDLRAILTVRLQFIFYKVLLLVLCIYEIIKFKFETENKTSTKKTCS